MIKILKNHIAIDKNKNHIELIKILKNHIASKGKCETKSYVFNVKELHMMK